MKKLRKYQIKALQYLRKFPAAALFMHMRLGKTLTAIRFYKQQADALKILVVGPYSVIAGWKEELSDEHQEFIHVYGQRKSRRETLAMFDNTFFTGLRTWFLINKECWKSTPEINALPWDVVILDESTFIKNPRAKITRFFTKYFRNVPYKMIMSGTPQTESELDYFCQLQFLDENILGYKNYWYFRQYGFMQAGYDWVIRRKTRDFLTQRLAQHCFFMTRAQAGIPDRNVFEKRVLELPDALRKAYAGLEKNFILELPNLEVKTMFAGAKFAFLCQICSGIIKGEIFDSFKLDELRSLLQGELKGEPVVIWAWFTDEIFFIHELLKKLKIPCAKVHGDVKPLARDKAKEDFQAGKLQVLVAQPTVWRYSTKLSRASAMINFSLPTGLLTWLQMVERALDIEKNNAVLNISLLSEDTVETDNYLSLQNKEKADQKMRRLIDGIQKRVNN